MMFEIAGGIILAVIILALWRVILALALIAAVLGSIAGGIWYVWHTWHTWSADPGANNIFLFFLIVFGGLGALSLMTKAISRWTPKSIVSEYVFVGVIAVIGLCGPILALLLSLK